MMVSDEGLKRKQGEIKVKASKKLISAIEEKISKAEEIFHQRVLPNNRHEMCRVYSSPTGGRKSINYKIFFDVESIAGFPHALLVWAYETLPSIVAKFTTKYDQAILRMLSWITANNVKFDDVMSAFTVVGENQPKCFVMMPTEEELKDPWVARLYLKNPKAVPQLPPKTSVPRPSYDTNSEWPEFQKEIRVQVASINKKLKDLKNG
ncbi:hypothetical protein TIFTF001_033911 [Ficus carica]|uniref:Uncharacterized protein n=1 Tax=Ficus carica TaxID=3494 RepID=A0AA88DZI9_FICCA|nr:hypothetical protein TIFTF001_033911 [Ficus carica]